MQELVHLRGEVRPEPRVHYLHHLFELPEGVTRLRVRLRFRKTRVAQLYLSLFGPDGYRGTCMKPGDVGEITLELELSEAEASPGGLPGALTPGSWRAQIDVERTLEDVAYELTVELSREPRAPRGLEPGERVRAARPPAAPGPAYYRGELHCHSHHSDGRGSVREVVEAARRYGLDFLSLTDHFSSAGWEELDCLAGPDLAVLKGLELTGHFGHANLQGLREWVDVFADPGNPAGRNVNDVIDDTHAQGGLFCVNHPFSLTLGWRYHELDWARVDLLEVYHHLTGSNNAAQLGLWDGLLRAGHRVVGVGATDSHHPHLGPHKLGQVLTCVYAQELSPAAILEGLRRGRVYVSLGPTLEFCAESAGKRYHMGESLPAGESVRLHAEVGGLDFPARLLVMKNGLHHAFFDLPAAEGLQTFELEDGATPGYYRLELYARGTQPSFETGREWDRTLALGNPIFVGT